MSKALSDGAIMTPEATVASLPERSEPPRRIRNVLLAMCFVALLLRMCVRVFLYKEFIDPSRGYWHFGWEIV